MKEIKLTGTRANGISVQVDDDMYEYLTKWKWHMNMKGYATRSVISSKTKKIAQLLMHRAILNITDGSIWVDHKDGNPLNNQKNNLRTCTKSENGANRKKKPNCSSKYVGVSLNSGRWQACCKKNYRRYFSYHKTEIEAALAYNILATEHHGEFAKLNIIDHE